MNCTRLRETDVGQAVVAHLEAQGWAVYPEVELQRGPSGIADIVAVRGQVVWVVECKVRLTLDLLRQAWRWRGFANLISVAFSQGGGVSDLALLSRLEMGYFLVRFHPVQVVTRDQGPLHPCACTEFLEVVDGRHRNATPGAVGGGRYTPLDVTLANFTEYVKEHPGIALREAVKHIRHHCQSNRSAAGTIRQYVRPYAHDGRCPVVLTWRHGRQCCDLVDEGVM